MNSKEFNRIQAQLEKLNAYLKNDNVALEKTLTDSSGMLKLLNCSESTLKRYRQKGILPCCKIGGRYYYVKHLLKKEILNSIIKTEDSSKRFDD